MASTKRQARRVNKRAAKTKALARRARATKARGNKAAARKASARKPKTAKKTKAKSKARPAKPARKTAAKAAKAPRIVVKGKMGPRFGEILTKDALAFIAELHRNFDRKRRDPSQRAPTCSAASTRA
jgi:malate synthase